MKSCQSLFSAPIASSVPVRFALFALLLSSVTASHAHTDVGAASGFLSGFLHPVFGVDHLIAMVAVGLWGAQLGKPAIWILPITFPAVMALGALFGIAGLPLPGVEIGIAASALILGLMVTFAAKPALWIAGLVVAAFALWHGHAHGTEIPDATNPLAYGIGFVVSTGLLHLAGIIIGLLVRWPAGAIMVRASGSAIAALGVYFLGANLGLLA
ncbi:HupE/UreJ family protein [Thiosocius teredinicola]|uniref:HupE/UreJ family protein n=1 Tax=Thiosocius teredinicola TaxID=1973002 RepID=UPI0009914213